MTGQLSNRKRLLLRTETVNGTSDNPSDAGALAVPVDTTELGFAEIDPEMLEFQRQTGENEPTNSLIGGGMGKVSFTMALKGPDGTATTPPGSNLTAVSDALTILCNSAFADRVFSVSDTCLAAGSTVNDLACTTAAWGKNDILCLYEAGLLTPNRAMWVRSAGTASPYPVDPTMEAVVTNSTIAYGTEIWRKPSFPSALGSSLSAVIEQDGIQHELTFCRPSSLKITYTARQVVLVSCELVGRTSSRTNYASLPDAAVTGPSELQGRLCRIKYGDTVVDTSQCELDFGLKQKLVLGADDAEGISDNVITRYDPVVTFSPLYSTDWEDAVANSNRQTGGTPTQANIDSLQLMYGAGALSGGFINSGCLWGERAQILAAPTTDDDELMRNGISIKLVSPEFPAALQTGGADRGHMFSWCRA